MNFLLNDKFTNYFMNFTNFSGVFDERQQFTNFPDTRGHFLDIMNFFFKFYRLL